MVSVTRGASLCVAWLWFSCGHGKLSFYSMNRSSLFSFVRCHLKEQHKNKDNCNKKSWIKQKKIILILILGCFCSCSFSCPVLMMMNALSRGFCFICVADRRLCLVFFSPLAVVCFLLLLPCVFTYTHTYIHSYTHGLQTMNYMQRHGDLRRPKNEPNWWMDGLVFLASKSWLLYAALLRGQTAERWKCLTFLSLSPSLSLADPLRDVTCQQWFAHLHWKRKEKNKAEHSRSTTSSAACSNQRLKDLKNKKINWKEKENNTKHIVRGRCRWVLVLLLYWRPPRSSLLDVISNYARNYNSSFSFSSMFLLQ